MCFFAQEGNTYTGHTAPAFLHASRLFGIPGNAARIPCISFEKSTCALGRARHASTAHHRKAFALRASANQKVDVVTESEVKVGDVLALEVRNVK
jgi:hypothetical protein